MGHEERNRISVTWSPDCGGWAEMDEAENKLHAFTQGKRNKSATRL